MDFMKSRRNSTRPCLKAVAQYQPEEIKVLVKARIKPNFRMIHSARAITRPLLGCTQSHQIVNEKIRPKSKPVRPVTAKPVSTFIHSKGFSHQLLQGVFTSNNVSHQQLPVFDKQIAYTANNILHITNKVIGVNDGKDDNAMKQSTMLSKFLYIPKDNQKKLCSIGHNNCKQVVEKRQFLKKNQGTKRSMVISCVLSQNSSQNYLKNREDLVKSIVQKVALFKGFYYERKPFKGSGVVLKI